MITWPLRRRPSLKIVGLEKRLQLSKEDRSSLVKKATEQEARIENLVAHLRDSEAEITHAKNDIGAKKNRRIRAESELKTAVENTRRPWRKP